MPKGVCVEEVFKASNQSLLFFWGNKLRGCAKKTGAARFDFGHDELTTPLAENINLTKSAVEVSLDDAVAALNKMVRH